MTRPRFVTIFDDTYNQPDARAYYAMQTELGYRNHHHALPVLRAVLRALAETRRIDAPDVLDFASSYGIVSTLMKYDIATEAFFARYSDGALDALTPDQTMAADRTWLASLGLRAPAARYFGLDVAENAVDYGAATGVFDAGFAENLQDATPSPALAARLADIDLVVECGSVAHLMPAALDRVLSAARGPKPWVVTSTVRGNERQDAFRVMQDHGLVIDTLGLPPFPHRRFESDDEQARAIAIARAAGHDTAQYEDTGTFFAQIYLARPKSDSVPITLLNV